MANQNVVPAEQQQGQVCKTCAGDKEMWPGTEVPKIPPTRLELARMVKGLLKLQCQLRGALASYILAGERPEEPLDEVFDRHGDAEIMRGIVCGQFGALVSRLLAQLDNEHCGMFLQKLGFAAKTQLTTAGQRIGRHNETVSRTKMTK